VWPFDDKFDLIASRGWQIRSMTYRRNCGLDIFEAGCNGLHRSIPIERVVEPQKWRDLRAIPAGKLSPMLRSMRLMARIFLAKRGAQFERP
jgi:hypothetical protein